MHQDQRKKNSEEQKKKDSLINCEICNDTGFTVYKDEKGYDMYKPCKCMQMAKVQRIWEQSGISVNDIDKTFKNFEAWNQDIKDMKDKVTSYLIQFDKIKNDRNNSILLSGKSGCGKTHLSLALANNLLKKKEVAVVYMPYRDIITSLKQNMLDEDYYRKTLAKYQKAEVLLIDDLLKGKITESDVNIMFELINYRYLNRLPMIISTEYGQRKLLDFDEAIGSRIYEMCKGYVVEIKGKGNNYRLR